MITGATPAVNGEDKLNSKDGVRKMIEGGPKSRKMDWAERLAVGAIVAAIASIVIYGAVLSAIAFALAALMGWTRAFDEVRATGKRTLSSSGRLIVASCLALLGVLAFPSTGAQRSETQSPSTATVDEGNDAEAAAGNASAPQVTLIEGQAQERRNRQKIIELIGVADRLAKRDYEGQVAVWEDITKLAPVNVEYARRLNEAESEVARLEGFKEHPEQGMVVEKTRARKKGFGNVLVVDLTLRNDALSYLKDFVITCRSSGPSGTVMDSNTRTLYEVVEARSTRTFRNVNMGFVNSQAASTNCVVDEATIA